MSKGSDQYITSDVLLGLIEGSHEYKREALIRQISAKDAGLSLLASYDDHAIVFDDDGAFFEVPLVEGCISGEYERLHIPTLTEAEAQVSVLAEGIANDFLQEARVRSSEGATADYVVSFLEAPRTWKRVFEGGSATILSFMSKSSSAHNEVLKTRESPIISEGIAQKYLSSMAEDPVKSLESLRERVVALATSVKSLMQQIPVGVLSEADSPVLEEAFGAFTEDLGLDLVSLSNTLLAASKQITTPHHSRRVCASIHQHLPCYEEAALFVDKVVGRLRA